MRVNAFSKYEKDIYMDLGVNNVSFQGNLLTRIKGNGDILDLVKIEFAKQTKGIDGNLRLSRTYRHYEPESLDLNYRRVNITTSSGLHKLLLKDPRWLPKDGIANIASEFVGIFKAMKIQNSYLTRAIRAHKEYTKALAEIRRLTYEQFRAERADLGVLAERYAQTIEKHRAVAKSSKAKIDEDYKKTVEAMDKFSSNIIGDELRASVPIPSKLHEYY
jgi:hypothetical protein